MNSIIGNIFSAITSAQRQGSNARSAAPEVAAVVSDKVTSGRDLAIHLPASLRSPN